MSWKNKKAHICFSWAFLLCLSFTPHLNALQSTNTRPSHAHELPLEFTEALQRYAHREIPKPVNGVPAPKKSHPWQVSLGVAHIANQHEAHFCGASIIDDQWILTAAHCVRGLEPSDFLIAAGATTLGRKNARYNASKVIIHPKYDKTSQDNDIALIHLRDRLLTSASVRPIRLPRSIDEEQNLVQGKYLRVTGWGATREGGSPVSTLMMIDVPYVAREYCNDFSSYSNKVTDNMLCAGFDDFDGIKDACQGDSGGPMVAGIKGKDPVLVGIVSWGEGCARPGKYGVYSRVAVYTQWIDSCRRGVAEC